MIRLLNRLYIIGGILSGILWGITLFSQLEITINWIHILIVIWPLNVIAFCSVKLIWKNPSDTKLRVIPFLGVLVGLIVVEIGDYRFNWKVQHISYEHVNEKYQTIEQQIKMIEGKDSQYRTVKNKKILPFLSLIEPLTLENIDSKEWMELNIDVN
ncbi:hypothetical protein [Flammeovirga agarivorans]|uniref:Uncharacterized protein n=1 Tax=Flammeovirga agarivorans TaxID=2726742 RepID=A0A7X8SRG4_9BACT|nr:hypothetical protein [Flammeovirga agarivorans]NLR95052.1 hypothetical protein [Flammeovirga agarivorans]